MAHNLTETSTFDADVEVPDSGDARTAASVETPFQALANRTRWLFGAVSGLLIGRRRLYTATAVSGIGVFVGGVDQLVIDDDVLSITDGTEVPGSLPLAAVSTWHYVYAYNNAGSAALQVSTDPPDASLTWKVSGDGTHRYIGAFRTDGSGNPIAFESEGGAYLWRTALSARQPVAAQNPTTPTNGDFSSYAPPHARILRVHMNGIDTGGTARNASLSKDGDNVVAAQLQIPANTRVTMETEVPCSTAQVIDYQVSHTDANLTLSAMGWRE